MYILHCYFDLRSLQYNNYTVGLGTCQKCKMADIKLFTFIA